MKTLSEARIQPQEEGMPCIRHSAVTCLGQTLRYRLLEQAPRFFLEITFGEEKTLLELGEGFANAARIFELFFCGTVTPCTAQDILQDLMLERSGL